MCPDRARPSFASPAVGAAAAWLVYAAAYTVSFGLSGTPIAFAISAAVANALPDAIVAALAIRNARRADRDRTAGSALFRFHGGRAVVIVLLAAASKSLLIWFDVVIVNRTTYQFTPAVITWHVFLSGLMYIAIASMAHAWLIARRLQAEEAHAARVESLRAQAEMAALRAQLNPHFLFNTLHSVLGLVRRDPALAETALEKLGDLLHYAIRVHRDGVDWTSLRHEWEFTRAYLDLEAIRLGDRLTVEPRVDDAVLDQRVPTFSIQPLVENAVRHGISPRAAGGRIWIDARPGTDHLSVEVSNDADWGERTSLEGGSREGGLGLRVLRERLDTLYRGAARMTAGPTSDGRYRVVLTLPLGHGEIEALE